MGPIQANSPRSVPGVSPASGCVIVGLRMRTGMRGPGTAVGLLAGLLLAACNMPSLQPTLTPSAAIIRGIVWHDLCGLEGGTGCVPLPEGGFRANGRPEAGEPGIDGVQIDLGDGSCPSAGLSSTLTGPDGSFAFIGHNPGTYCVSIDSLNLTNNQILVPGEWTVPISGEPMVTLEVLGGEDHAGVDFGWDYQFLPAFATTATPPPGSPTAESPLVTAIVNANCRSGPGTVYDVVGSLPEGQTAEARGRDELGGWWWIRLPATDSDCWISNLTVNINFSAADLAQVPAPPTPTPSLGSIDGRVWHDLCGIIGGEGGAPPTPTPGCVEIAAETYEANGIMESGEPGLSGVLVNLGLGSCPAIGLAATTTGSEGQYAFAGLDGGTYCVSIDALGAINSNILVPGGWSHPRGDSLAAIVITLGQGENPGEVNFGWDYQFLP